MEAGLQPDRGEETSPDLRPAASAQADASPPINTRQTETGEEEEQADVAL